MSAEYTYIHIHTYIRYMHIYIYIDVNGLHWLATYDDGIIGKCWISQTFWYKSTHCNERYVSFNNSGPPICFFLHPKFQIAGPFNSRLHFRVVWISCHSYSLFLDVWFSCYESKPPNLTTPATVFLRTNWRFCNTIAELARPHRARLTSTFRLHWSQCLVQHLVQTSVNILLFPLHLNF